MFPVDVDVQVDDAIRTRAGEWLTGQLSREDFEEWFVGTTWDHDTALVGELNALLAELDVMAPDEFAESVRRAVSTVWVHEHVGVLIAATASETIARPVIEVGGDHTIRRRLAFAGS